MNENDKTAILYCRVSTTRQAEEELPIQSQQQRCEDKAQSLGATVLRIYTDEGISGQSDSRPAFQQAILYCETHSPTYLITWNTSRFARNRLDAQLYKRRLSRAGTILVYASVDIDRETDSGWLTEGILELFDEFTSKQIAADTRRSMIKAAQDGYWCGGRLPFGYRSVPAADDPKRRRLEVVPEEAPIVKRAFLMRARGSGARTIAIALNDDGQINRHRVWNKSSVLDLLRNQAMIGHIVFGRTITIAGRQQPAPVADWIVVPSHIPIIDLDLWATVQQQLDADAMACKPMPDHVSHGSPRSTYLFTGLLQCGVCGAPLQIETAKGRSHRYSYYNCRDSRRNSACPPRRFPARDLDDWLLNIVCADVFTPHNLRQTVQDLQEITGRWHIERAERRKVVDAKIKDIKRRNGKLYEILEELGRETPNLGDLTRRLRENNAQLKQFEEQRIAIDAEIPPRVTIDDADLEDLAEMLIATIKTGDNPAKTRTLLRDFIQTIVVESTVVRIEYDPKRLIGALPTGSHRVVPSEGNWHA
ncbi:MAG: recombinase family protein [Gammaproteobacteria bacterium]|nr:recombinase family protein [Gammaproteobacteria bacterium]